MRYLGVALVWAYRLVLRPFLDPGSCKYHPSCSQYAIDAYKEFGFFKGTMLATWRLLRCNPFSHGGIDELSDRRLFRDTAGRSGRRASPSAPPTPRPHLPADPAGRI